MSMKCKYENELRIFLFFQINDIASYVYNYLSNNDLVNLLNSKVKLLCNKKMLLKKLFVIYDCSEFKFDHSDNFVLDETDRILEKKYYKFINKLYLLQMSDVGAVIPYLENITNLKINEFDVTVFNNFSNFNRLDSIRKLQILSFSEEPRVPMLYPKNLETLVIGDLFPFNFPKSLRKIKIMLSTYYFNLNLQEFFESITISNKYFPIIPTYVENLFTKINFQKCRKLKKFKLIGFKNMLMDPIFNLFPDLKKLITNNNHIGANKIPNNLEHFECNIIDNFVFFPRTIKYIKTLVLSYFVDAISSLDNLDNLEYLDIGFFDHIFPKLPPNIKVLKFSILCGNYYDNVKNNSSAVWNIVGCNKLESVSVNGFNGVLVIPDSLGREFVVSSGAVVCENDFEYLCSYVKYPFVFSDICWWLNFSFDHNEKLFRILIDIFVKSNGDFLYNLVLNNRIKILKKIIVLYGFDVNVKTSWGNTLLHGACSVFNHSIVKFLVNRGIKNMRNSLGKYPIDHFHYSKISDNIPYKIMIYLKNKGYDHSLFDN